MAESKVNSTYNKMCAAMTAGYKKQEESEIDSVRKKYEDLLKTELDELANNTSTLMNIKSKMYNHTITGMCENEFNFTMNYHDNPVLHKYHIVVTTLLKDDFPASNFTYWTKNNHDSCIKVDINYDDVVLHQDAIDKLKAQKNIKDSACIIS